VSPSSESDEEEEDFFHVKPEGVPGEAVIAINYWFDMKFDIKYNYYKLVDTLVKAKYFVNEEEEKEGVEQ
jgi:hypothetical protein